MNERLHDIRKFNIKSKKWKINKNVNKISDSPEARMNFAFTAYRENFGILFGGAGNYLSKIK
jgi:hypothetical protein